MIEISFNCPSTHRNGKLIHQELTDKIEILGVDSVYFILRVLDYTQNRSRQDMIG